MPLRVILLPDVLRVMQPPEIDDRSPAFVHIISPLAVMLSIAVSSRGREDIWEDSTTAVLSSSYRNSFSMH